MAYWQGQKNCSYSSTDGTAEQENPVALLLG